MDKCCGTCTKWRRGSHVGQDGRGMCRHKIDARTLRKLPDYMIAAAAWTKSSDGEECGVYEPKPEEERDG